jgi:hypothetical protein
LFSLCIQSRVKRVRFAKKANNPQAAIDVHPNTGHHS